MRARVFVRHAKQGPPDVGRMKQDVLRAGLLFTRTEKKERRLPAAIFRLGGVRSLARMMSPQAVAEVRLTWTLVAGREGNYGVSNDTIQ